MNAFNRLGRLTYVQSGNYCVLASYMVAVYPWLGKDPAVGFVDYCEHYQLNDNRSPEERYLADFVKRYSAPGMSGYKVLEQTHVQGSGIFESARKAVRVELLSAMADEDHILRTLRAESCSTAMVFVNESEWEGLSRMHSITLVNGIDRLFHYDVNDGKLIPSVVRTLAELGEVGEAILFTSRS